MLTSFPLCWPAGWKRTEQFRQRNAAFRRKDSAARYGSRALTVYEATQRVLQELERMGVDRDEIIISTNVRLRLDGLPRSNEPEPKDRGAAVYWKGVGLPMRCMAVDQYTTVADNLAAIAATLDAMRAIERHGGAQILDRAFTGFAALPEHASRPWRDVLEIPQSTHPNMQYIETRFRELASIHHPDKGGNVEKFHEIVTARDAARIELGGKAQ